METLSTKIQISKEVIQASNLCGRFEDADLTRVGNWVYECYNRDLESRKTWARRTEAAMDLAMQVSKEKSYPWQGCSNVAFPLVTIAALQFHARAYPAIINGQSVVQCRVIGDDPMGVMKARADRISSHMSWQLLEQDESWEEEQDRALLNVPIVGCVFKKSYFDASKGYNVSEVVLAKNLVLDYWARSVDECATKTHIFQLYRNEIHEAVRRGTFRDILGMEWYEADAPVMEDEASVRDNQRRGFITADSNHNTPFTFLEQHCSLDLDQDGYAEPYIVTIEASTQTVIRIVTRFVRIEDVEYDSRKRIIKVTPLEYFTKMPFIPSPDGGIMDVGFGVLLGPLNESVNTSINQLIDSGTMSNTAGGFLGRGAKIRGGVYQFQPFGWNRVDSTGDDLRKNLVPLPVREPSNVLFNLLSLLIDYTNRIAGSTDMMAGENPGQNTPAETSRAMVEQGQKIYSAIFKRIWRSMKQEFKKLYILNSIYLPDKVPFGDGGGFAMREDYASGPGGVYPVADPLISSEGARFARATLLAARAASNPGYNQDAVEEIYLRALGIDQIKQVYPGQANMPAAQPDVKLQIQQLKSQDAAATLQFNKLSKVAELQELQRLNNAKIESLMADAFKAQQEGEGVVRQDQINAYIAATTAVRAENDHLARQAEQILKEIENDRTDARERELQRVASSSSDKKA